MHNVLGVFIDVILFSIAPFEIVAFGNGFGLKKPKKLIHESVGDSVSRVSVQAK